jgi:hypothetical protein
MTFLTTKADVTKALGYFWHTLFLDSDFTDAYISSVAVPLSQLASEVKELSDYMSRSLVPEKVDHVVRLFIFDETTEDTAAYHYGDDGLTYGGGAVYGKDRVGNTNRLFQIDPAFTPAFLTADLFSPGTVWRLGQDYAIENGWIRFFKDPLDIQGLDKKTKIDADGQVFYTFFLWGFQVTEDIKALNKFFGNMVGYCGASSAATKDAINLAWDLRIEGATVRNVHRLLSLLTDVDHVHTAGTVADVYTEGNKVCVHTNNAVYTAPTGTTVLVSVGEDIEASQIIFDAFVIRQGNEEIDFEDFEGVALGGSHLPHLNGDLFFVNDLVPVTRIQHPDWFSVSSQ